MIETYQVEHLGWFWAVSSGPCSDRAMVRSEEWLIRDPIEICQTLMLMVSNVTPVKTGWWFGTCFIFHILGISQSQLIFIFFRGVGIPPTRKGPQCKLWWVDGNHLERVPFPELRNRYFPIKTYLVGVISDIWCFETKDSVILQILCSKYCM